MLQLAFLQEPPEGDDYHELQRFARSHHPLSLHPSWGVPTLAEPAQHAVNSYSSHPHV